MTADRVAIPELMEAVLLVGHGGYDRLEHRTDIPVPRPAHGEVLVRVRACGLNNTDINTRIGWYASTVREGITSKSAAGGFGTPADMSGGWSDPLEFPRIQGADVCGEVVAFGHGVDGDGLLGRRVLIDPWWLDPADPADQSRARYFGSEVDGGFAQYCVAPAVNVYPIHSELANAELATFACSTGTAEYLLTVAEVQPGDTVVVTGASGGVGTAAVQLARARGAYVVAIASASKADAIVALGAHAVVDRATVSLAAAVIAAAPNGRIDAIADVVGGRMFEQLVPLLRRGGRYATSGAIAGPIVEFDLRDLIYGDLHFGGATVCPPGTFARVVAAIEAGAVRPVLAATYPLAELVTAQQAFVTKQHIGNIVIESP